MMSINVIKSKRLQRDDIYWNNNITYYVTGATKECNKMPVSFLPGLMPWEVPTSVRSGVLDNVPVQIWEYKVYFGTYTWYVTEDKCMFVMLTLTQSNDLGSISWYFYDMQEGIKDPSVFDLPKICVKQN